MRNVSVSLEAIEEARVAEIDEALRLRTMQKQADVGQADLDPLGALKVGLMNLGPAEGLSDERFVALCISYGGLHARLSNGALHIKTEYMTPPERRIWRASVAGKGHPLAPQIINNVEWRLAMPLLEVPFTEAELPHIFSSGSAVPLYKH